jgi:hypothetical protein
MRNVRIPTGIAVLAGVVMAIWGSRIQKPMDQQTDGEFILSNGLMVGGMLIAMMACFTVGRSSKKLPS